MTTGKKCAMCGKHEHWFNRSHRRLRLRRGGILRVEKRLQKHGYAGRIYILDTNEFTDDEFVSLHSAGGCPGDAVSTVLTPWVRDGHRRSRFDDHL